MTKIILIAGLTAALFLPVQALAYVGPGAGITMLGALWGVIVAILAALGAVLFWPIRSVIRKRKKRLATDVKEKEKGKETVSTNAESADDERGDHLSD